MEPKWPISNHSKIWPNMESHHADRITEWNVLWTEEQEGNQGIPSAYHLEEIGRAHV